jgi:hypothetical protein
MRWPLVAAHQCAMGLATFLGYELYQLNYLLGFRGFQEVVVCAGFDGFA